MEPGFFCVRAKKGSHSLEYDPFYRENSESFLGNPYGLLILVAFAVWTRVC